MKKVFLKMSVLMLGLSIGLSSCKKNKDEEPDDTQEQMLTASDQSMVSDESNQAVDDVNGAFSNSASLGGRIENFIPCGATVDSIIGDRKITITYNGNTCDYRRKRTGTITAQLIKGEHWKEAGAVIHITFTNFKVIRLADSRSIMINGTHDVTNVNGGLIISMGNGESMVHRVRANMSITFDDGTVRTWRAARLQTFALDNGTYTISEAGDTTVNGDDNAIVWGANRKGNNFTAINSTPIKVSTCGSAYPYTWKIINGVRIHKGLAREITITFGLDYDANIFSNDCSATGYKINWIGALNKPKEAKVKIYN